jgi:alpha-1,2-mannosyltransferase
VLPSSPVGRLRAWTRRPPRVDLIGARVGFLRRVVARPAVVFAFTVAACAFGLVMAFMALRSAAIDLEVYRAGGRAVLGGTPLYQEPLWAGLRFTYPPWAAILFTPFAPLPSALAQTIAVIGNCALLVFTALWSWRAVGIAPGRRLIVLSSVTASLLFCNEAVHATVYVGQVNLVLLALILGDLLRDDDHKSKGIGLGIAAGIKLTPLIFLLYLVVTRRYRAACVATATFLATVAAGFLILPHDSVRYWLAGTFADTSRIYTDVASRHNQSLRGMLLRLGISADSAQAGWLVLALGTAAGTIVVAAWASRRGEQLLAVTLCGLCSAALSPWSWGHHWVWLVPLAVFLVRLVTQHVRWTEHSTWFLPGLLLPLTFPWVLALADPPDSSASSATLTSGPAAFVLGNLYVLIFFAALVASVAHLRHLQILKSARDVDQSQPVIPAL